MISGGSFRPIFACRAAHLYPRLRGQGEEDIVRVGQYVRRIFRFVIRLLPFISNRLPTLGLSTLSFAGVQCRAISRLSVARFGERRYCQVPRIRDSVLNRKGRRDHLARNKANNGGGGIQVLPTKDRLIRFHGAALGTARAINSYHDLLGRFMNLIGSQVGLHMVLLRILLQSLGRLTFHFLRRIIRVRHFVGDLTLGVAYGHGRFTYR